MAKKSKRKAVKPRKAAPKGSLLNRLRSSVHADRNLAALELRDLVEEAKRALWQSIRKRSNRNNRGTLVYTLELFDCAADFDQLVDLAINGNYEVQCHALRILQRQSFCVEKAQMRAARRLVRALRPRVNLPAPDARLLRAELESALRRIERSRIASDSYA